MEAEYEKICQYCERATPGPDPDHMTCRLRGVVECGKKCFRFVYDPLKRKPRVPKKPEFDDMPQI